VDDLKCIEEWLFNGASTANGYGQLQGRKTQAKHPLHATTAAITRFFETTTHHRLPNFDK